MVVYHTSAHHYYHHYHSCCRRLRSSATSLELTFQLDNQIIIKVIRFDIHNILNIETDTHTHTHISRYWAVDIQPDRQRRRPPLCVCEAFVVKGNVPLGTRVYPGVCVITATGLVAAVAPGLALAVRYTVVDAESWRRKTSGP